MSDERPLGVWALTTATAVAALLVQWFLVRPLTADVASGSPYAWFAIVTFAFLVTELCVVHVRLGRHAYTFSLSEVPLVVGIFFLTPGLLVVAWMLGTLLANARRRLQPRKVAFNLALVALETPVAVTVWHSVLGDADPYGPWGWLSTIMVALVVSVLSSALVSVAIAVDTRELPSKLSDVFSLGQVADVVNAVFALVVVYVVSVDWRASWIVAVVMAVLVLAHRVSERLQMRTERLEQVNRFTGQVGRQLDTEAVVLAVLEHVYEAVEAQTLEIRVVDDDAGYRCWLLSTRQPAAVAVERATLLDVFCPSESSESVLAPSNTKSPSLREALRTAGVEDFVAVPIRVDGQVIGTLGVADRLGDVDTFTKDDVQQLEALANHAGVALANAGRADQLRRQAAEREYQAMHDELTGLANRRLFDSSLAQIRESGSAAVLMLDLDRFKEINDTLGHLMGDDLLRLVAERLTEVAPAEALVARFGGDEFALLLPEGDRLAALACASMITTGLARPFPLAGLNIAVDVSVGVAVVEPGVDATSLVRCADVAMYAAKASRRGVEVYRSELDGYDPERLTLLADLREAVAANAFTVVYQPKVHITRGRVHGVEALVRWNHPRHGAIGPDDFIPLAEHSGLISPLTMIVLRAALRQCEQWREGGHEISVAVNISPRSLLDRAFVDEVAHALAAVAVPARALTLEITENSLMAEPERAIESLHQLRRLGVQLSVDDLGTGYSSLAYLQRLPVDEVKIDRSFVQAMPDEAAEAIVGAITDLGHRLGRRVVAEGVETEAAYDLLRGLGCDIAQGYWISRPLASEAVADFLRTWHVDRPLRSVG
ncbi:MAG TPA: bifunctional diguanylate cyclase/phosphodiesterase [Nocardioidaceae bacterium]|nr:bifunctional diguanylate cyclase/phosphodiesterase [Nocardioidaceae bacterium]